MEQQLQELSQRLTIIEAKFQSQIDDLQEKLERTIADRKEDFYQRYLEKALKGKHTKTRHGITDIETVDSIIEIKCWKNYKHVVGQLKAYAFDQKTKKRLVAAFYGGASEHYKEKAIEYINSEKINVIDLIDCADGSVVIKELGRKIGIDDLEDSQPAISESNVQSMPGDSRQTICESDVHNVCKLVKHLTLESQHVLKKNNIKTKYRQLFGGNITQAIWQSLEKEIIEKFGIEYKKSSLFRNFYRGWLGLRFKTKEELEQETE